MRRRLLISWLMLLPMLAAAQPKPYHGDGIDDVLMVAPAASVFALKICGVEGESSWKRLGVNAAVCLVMAVGTVQGLKRIVREERPDGIDRHSFPSGHTSYAFAGAHALYKEYGRRSVWIPVAGYAVVTGIDRVRRNRHHWYDVAAGAALGILCTEAGYWLGDKITGERKRYRVAVGPQSVSLTVGL